MLHQRGLLCGCPSTCQRALTPRHLPCMQEFDSNYSEVAEMDKGYYNTYFTQASLFVMA